YGRKEHFILPIKVSTARVDVSTAIGNLMMSSRMRVATVRVLSIVGLKPRNIVAQKDHFPLLFIDQMLERLAGHEYYCFLYGFLGYLQIPIALEDHEKTIFTCPYGIFAYKQMAFRLCNAPATFQCCMTAICHELIKEIIEASIVIKPDWSLPFEVMCDASDYAVGAVLGKRIDKHFKPIHYASNNERSTRETNEHVKNTNWETKSILKKTISNNRKDWCYKLDDALWAFQRAFKTPLGTTSFRLIYECTQAFDKLKHELTQASIVIKPDWSLPFEVMCDASDYAVGAVLGKRIDKHFKPIHYASNNERSTREAIFDEKKLGIS
nr:reverse transcriptase domain-containing protein [Tanacetum cinerariifolium]